MASIVYDFKILCIIHKPTPNPSKVPTLKLQRQRGGEFDLGLN